MRRQRVLASAIMAMIAAASMAASGIYQNAGLVQFGFTNTHPDFTKAGDYIWSNALSQNDQLPLLADFAVKRLGRKRLAVLHLNTDWGRTSKDLLVEAAHQMGAQIVASEAYLPDEKDFRSALVRMREAKPDGLVLISYYADGALIMRQVKATGLAQPIVAVASVYSPKFLELGGDAVNGVYTQSTFFPGDGRPEVQKFVERYREKYKTDPDLFVAYAYDTMILAFHLIKEFGADRKAIHDGLPKIKNVPSVIFGKAQFNPQTRRVSGAKMVDLVVKDGKFIVWDGSKPAAWQ